MVDQSRLQAVVFEATAITEGLRCVSMLSIAATSYATSRTRSLLSFAGLGSSSEQQKYRARTVVQCCSINCIAATPYDA